MASLRDILATPQVQAAIIAAIVSLLTTFFAAPLKYWLDKRSLNHKLETEYEYEQRKRLRELIGSYSGRFIEAGDRLGNRLWNLQQNESRGWLVSKPGEPMGYYFSSTLYRFVSFYCLVRQFEQEALYIEPRFAQARDFDFLKLVRAFFWVITDVSLFEGSNYDPNYQSDHIYSDNVRLLCDKALKDGKTISFENFVTSLGSETKVYSPMVNFFDGLNSRENRPRWDRLMCLHCFIMVFLNAFGYDIQYSTDNKFASVVARVKSDQICVNLRSWLGRLGISEHLEVRRLRRCLDTRVARQST